MEQAYNDILTIRNNVFTLTSILVSFYSECKQTKDNVFLAFIVLPLLFNEKWVAKKPKIQVGSKLPAWVMEDKFNIEGLPSRITYFHDITLKCIQYAIDMKWLKLNGTTLVYQPENTEWEKSKYYSDQLDTARNLNKLLKKLEVVEILTILGIKDIWKR